MGKREIRLGEGRRERENEAAEKHTSCIELANRVRLLAREKREKSEKY